MKINNRVEYLPLTALDYPDPTRALMLLPPSCSYCANLVYGLLGKRVRRESVSFLDMLQVKKMQLTWDLAELHIVGKDEIS